MLLFTRKQLAVEFGCYPTNFYDNKITFYLPANTENKRCKSIYNLLNLKYLLL